LAHRIAVRLRLREARAHVFLAQISDVHARILGPFRWRNAHARGKVTHFPSENR
jgi:hypothetical protein